MCVDMGQADASLYRKPSCAQFQISWLRAIDLAAKEMGYTNFMDVPDAELDSLKSAARRIQNEGG